MCVDLDNSAIFNKYDSFGSNELSIDLINSGVSLYKKISGQMFK